MIGNSLRQVLKEKQTVRDHGEPQKEFKDQTNGTDFDLNCALETFWKDQLNRIKDRAEGKRAR